MLSESKKQEWPTLSPSSPFKPALALSPVAMLVGDGLFSSVRLAGHAAAVTAVSQGLICGLGLDTLLSAGRGCATCRPRVRACLTRATVRSDCCCSFHDSNFLDNCHFAETLALTRLNLAWTVDCCYNGYSLVEFRRCTHHVWFGLFSSVHCVIHGVLAVWPAWSQPRWLVRFLALVEKNM